MRRTKEWWHKLAKWERTRLVELEWSHSSRSSYLPDDCCDCGGCGQPTLGYGLCPSCSQELERLITKANQGGQQKGEQDG